MREGVTCLDRFRIECFLASATYGSLSKAAAYMNITQPAMSFQIRELEKEIGVQLFERDNRGLSPTPAGELMREGLKPIAEMYDRLIERVRSSANESTRLTIGYHGPPNWAGISDFIADFCQRHPETEIVLNQHHMGDLAKYLDIGALDLAFILKEEIPDKKHISSALLFTEPPYMAVSPLNPLSKKPRITAEDLRDETIIMNNRASPGINTIIQRLYDSGLNKEQFLFFDQYDVTLAMASCNRGIAAVPESFHTVNVPLEYILFDTDSVWLDNCLAVNLNNHNTLAMLFMKEAQDVCWPYHR